MNVTGGCSERETDLSSRMLPEQENIHQALARGVCPSGAPYHGRL